MIHHKIYIISPGCPSAHRAESWLKTPFMFIVTVFLHINFWRLFLATSQEIHPHMTDLAVLRHVQCSEVWRPWPLIQEDHTGYQRCANVNKPGSYWRCWSAEIYPHIAVLVVQYSLTVQNCGPKHHSLFISRGMIHNKIHLASPGFLWPSIALQCRMEA